MILTLDIGNTSITCGVFDNENLVKKFSLPSNTDLTVIDYGELLSAELSSYELDGAIIGSVVDELNNRIQYAVLAQFGVMAVMLSHDSEMPITLAIKNNEELGADRIANGVRAFNLYKKAVIVVDFGTATTFDIVNSKGEFVGGSIVSGVNTQIKSLHSSTSKLPHIEIKKIDEVIGKTTEDAILSGVLYGTAFMVEGMLKKCEQELGQKPVVIATGGFSNVIPKYMERKFDLIAPDLTLEGLRDLYLLNKTDQPVYRF